MWRTGLGPSVWKVGRTTEDRETYRRYINSAMSRNGCKLVISQESGNHYIFICTHRVDFFFLVGTAQIRKYTYEVICSI